MRLFLFWLRGVSKDQGTEGRVVRQRIGHCADGK